MVQQVLLFLQVRMPAEPHGPYSLTDKGQVSIPKELRDAVGLATKGKVYFAQDPRVDGVLVVVPTAGLARWVAEVANTATQTHQHVRKPTRRRLNPGT